MPRSHVTIRDVAAHAGVSHQTVSRVINGSDHVSPKTAERVRAAIIELDYRPNAIARSMAKGRTGILACIAPNLTDYTFASIISGAETEARQRDYFLLSASAPDEATFAALIDQLVSARRVEGLMILNPYADNRHTHLPDNFPVVFAGARPREEIAYSVALNDVEVAREATRHLLELGHRRIGLITGPLAEDCSQDRRNGFHDVLQTADIVPTPTLEVEGDWSPASGYEALMAFYQKDELPTAIFAQNDQMAVGVLRAARDLGLQVPDDLSIIGVDDIPMAAYFAPPLTTMRQDFLTIGQEAASLLIQATGHTGASQRNLLLPAELIERRSTIPIA